MPTVQWDDIPYALVSPIGVLPLNPLNAVANPITTDANVDGPQWVLLPDGCQAGSAKRVTRDNQPQKSGEIVHRHFKTGLVFQLKMLAVDVQPGADGALGEFLPPCGEDLVDLFDLLCLHLNAMENADGRLLWTPSGKPVRMLLDCRWLGDSGEGGGTFTSVVTSQDTTILTAAEFALVSPFPYALDFTQTTTTIDDGDAATITQTGNTDMYPVVHAYGPSTAFTLTNATTGFQLKYDSTLPGASVIPSGHAVEFDFFRETGYFGPTGGPYTGASAKPGIVVTVSDFFPLSPGANDITVVGADVDILWQAAWTG
jgi:hypothetical protein